MALDATLVAELDKHWATGNQNMSNGASAGSETLRRVMDLAGTALSAAASNVLLLSSLPDQGMAAKLAYDTPRSSQDTVTK